MTPDDGCEGDFSILCDSWPMIFALYFKPGLKLRYGQSTECSLLCLVWHWSQGRRQERVRWMGTVVSMTPLKWYGSLLEFFFFLSGRPAGLKQLLGAPTQLALGNFFHNRERWRTQDPNEVFLYSVPNLPGSWAALRANITRMILRRSMGRETTVFGSQLFLPTLPEEAGAWNQQTILPLNWYRKLVWRKEKFLWFQWPFASIHSQRIHIYHI